MNCCIGVPRPLTATVFIRICNNRNFTATRSPRLVRHLFRPRLVGWPTSQMLLAAAGAPPVRFMLTNLQCLTRRCHAYARSRTLCGVAYVSLPQSEISLPGKASISNRLTLSSGKSAVSIGQISVPIFRSILLDIATRKRKTHQRCLLHRTALEIENSGIGSLTICI